MGDSVTRGIIEFCVEHLIGKKCPNGCNRIGWDAPLVNRGFSGGIMNEFKGWEKIRELGSGGQSTVFLVRTQIRAQIRRSSLLTVSHMLSGPNNPETCVESIADYLRDERPEELGALKVYDKVRPSSAPPEERIRREMGILRAGHPNLPKFLDGDSDGKWMVTELAPGSPDTISHFNKYCELHSAYTSSQRSNEFTKCYIVVLPYGWFAVRQKHRALQCTEFLYDWVVIKPDKKARTNCSVRAFLLSVNGVRIRNYYV